MSDETTLNQTEPSFDEINQKISDGIYARFVIADLAEQCPHLHDDLQPLLQKVGEARFGQNVEAAISVWRFLDTHGNVIKIMKEAARDTWETTKSDEPENDAFGAKTEDAEAEDPEPAGEDQIAGEDLALLDQLMSYATLLQSIEEDVNSREPSVAERLPAILSAAAKVMMEAHERLYDLILE